MDFDYSPYRIKAAIVAYNRSDSLKRLIESIQKQSYSVKEIIVIDNSTLDCVYNVIQERFPEIRYVRMKENKGSAGGFYKAIEVSVKDCDFIWLFDDDVSVKIDALQELVKWLPILEKNGKIGAIKSWYDDSKFHQPQPIEEFAWRGTMINSEAIMQVGFPEANFFLYGEDTDYSLRIKNAGFKMYLIPGSKMSVGGKESKMQLNLFGRKLVCHATPLRLYYAVRNEILIFIKHRMFLRFAKVILYSLKTMLFLLFSKKRNKMGYLSAIIMGLYDGISGKKGLNLQFHTDKPQIIQN